MLLSSSWSARHCRTPVGFTAARNAPDKFKAIIAIEPSGVPNPERVDVAGLKGVPHLVVWGDYMERYDRWLEIQRSVATYEEALRWSVRTTRITRPSRPSSRP